MAETDRQKKKIGFPMVAHYNCVVQYFVEQGLGQEYILQPQMTRRTMELGAKLAPDMVCTPFKTTLGSMIEALEAGADTLIMSFGLCRLGYYGELAEQILREQGYEFDYVNLAEYTTGKYRDYFKALRRVCPKLNAVRAGKVGLDALKMVEYIDEIEDLYHQNCGFALDHKACRAAYLRFFADMKRAKSRQDIDAGYQKAREALETLPLNKPAHPLRVALIGEYFTVMDEFSNLDLEETIADMGVELHRWMNLSHRNLHYPGEKNLNASIRDLCTYEMGPTSTANIWYARTCAEAGYDGIIHVKSAGCTPEIDIMPVLQRVGQQYKVPTLYLTYDSQTATAGLQTRLEAFYDMIDMRRKVRA